MKTVKRVLRPERLRQVPEQFSWVDQALVQRHVIDRCDARAAALYLFLVTVADAQGMSYYGAATLAQRLHLSTEELDAVRAQLIELELIAYQAPLYQVLALPGTQAARRTAATVPVQAPVRENSTGPVSIAQLLDRMGRGRA
jgi:hypothetical protein